SVISDNGGDRSLFVQELLKEIRVPALMAEETLNRTRVGVTRASRSEQVPWVSSSLAEGFSFIPGGSGPRASTPPAPPGGDNPPTPAPPAGGRYPPAPPAGAADDGNPAAAPASGTDNACDSAAAQADRGQYS